MCWWKKAYVFYILFIFTVISGIYGCGYQKSAVMHEEPPYMHGHVEETPPAKHMRLHEGKPVETKGDMLIASGAYPTGDKECCSVIYIEETGPKTGNVGQSYCYSLKVTNLTNTRVENVEVIQTLPQNFKIESSDPEMEEGTGIGVAKWYIGELEPKETKVIKVCGIPAATGDMPFCADVSYNLPGVCISPHIVQPELEIVKRAPPEVLLCDKIVFTFIVSNSGTGVAKGVQVKESLPSGLKTLDGKTDVVHSIGMLHPGESREISLTVKADKAGTYTNTAAVVAEDGLSAESNTTTTIVRQPVLTIAKTGRDKIFTGGKLTYEITISNTGDGDAASTIVEDTIPANTSFISASEGGRFSDGVVTWDLGTLPPDDSRKVSLSVKAESLGMAKNTVTATAVCAESVSDSIATEVVGVPAILLEVIDIADPILIGDTETYEITVTNQGSEVATNIEISCTLEDTMEYVSSSGPTQGTLEVNKVVFEPLPTLGSRAKATWKVVVKAVKEGDARFKVEMIEDCLTRPVEETEATHFYSR